MPSSEGREAGNGEVDVSVSAILLQMDKYDCKLRTVVELRSGVEIGVSASDSSSSVI